MKSLFFLFLFFAAGQFCFSQQASYNDAAQAYNRLLIEKGNGSYIRINNYKVTGTPYLFGGKNISDLFVSGKAHKNIEMSYNTFSNQIEVYTTNDSKNPLVMEEGAVDSFTISSKVDDSDPPNLTFICSKVLGADDKGFYLRMYDGQFALYKKYNTTLGIVTSNYIESDLRQFELNYDYYYLNKNTGKLKKIKFNYNGLKKEFGTFKDISSVLDNGSFDNRDKIISAIFEFLNTKSDKDR